MENKLIYQNMINIFKDVEYISKDKKNVQQNYSFRGIDDMYNSLHGLFVKHETFITSEVISEKREERTTQKGGTLLYTILTVKFTCWAKDGSSIFSIMIGEAMDSGDKASNKAMSTALKYFLMQTFLIPTEEEKDTEFQSHEVKTNNINLITQMLVALPDPVKAAFKALMYNRQEIENICEKYSWDNIKILEHLNAAGVK